MDVYVSCEHPEWIAAEMRYAHARARGYSPQDPGRAWYDEWVHYVEELDRIREELACPDAKDEPFLAAVEQVGLDVLRDNGHYAKDDERKLVAHAGRRLSEIRRLLWERIEGWYASARDVGSPASSARSQRMLRRLGDVLAADRRGTHKKKRPTDYIIRLAYYETLFKLEQASKLWKVWPWTKDLRTRRRAIADAVGLVLPVLENVLPRVNPAGEPQRALLRPKAAARIATASKFNVTEPAISNILSKRFRPFLIKERRSSVKK